MSQWRRFSQVLLLGLTVTNSMTIHLQRKRYLYFLAISRNRGLRLILDFRDQNAFIHIFWNCCSSIRNVPFSEGIDSHLSAYKLCILTSHLSVVSDEPLLYSGPESFLTQIWFPLIVFPQMHRVIDKTGITESAQCRQRRNSWMGWPAHKYSVPQNMANSRLSWKSWTLLHSTTTPQCASYRAASSLWEYALRDWGLNSLHFRWLLSSHMSASPHKVHIILVPRSHKGLQVKNWVSVFASRSSAKLLNQILCLHFSLYLITWMQEGSEKHNHSILIFQRNLQSKTVDAHRLRFSYPYLQSLFLFHELCVAFWNLDKLSFFFKK